MCVHGFGFRPDWGPLVEPSGVLWRPAVDQVLVGQTLLFSAFPLSLILAGENRHLERWPRPVRWIVMGATLAAMFGFFLAATLVAMRL